MTTLAEKRAALAEKEVAAIREEMLQAAKEACRKWTETHDDWDACGFAWATIYPKFKGNTKNGKIERAVYEALGFSQSYNKSYQLWNPGQYRGQSITAIEVGAKACADVLTKYGFNASWGSRLD